jgi:hypothetical protein
MHSRPTVRPRVSPYVSGPENGLFQPRPPYPATLVRPALGRTVNVFGVRRARSVALQPPQRSAFLPFLLAHTM